VSEAILARGLSKRFGRRVALDDVDLSVAPGELVGLLGPNGAGKTTLLRLVLGLVRPSGGELTVFGEPPGGPALVRVGAVAERPSFWDHLSARRNLAALARASRAGDPAARVGRIDEVLDRVGLRGAADVRVRAFSQGMRQRLAIALALLGRPDLLVLDEPANGLDPGGIAEVRTLLRSLRDAGAAVVVSSHLLAELGPIADRLVILSRGRVVVGGTPAALAGDGDLEAAYLAAVEVDDVRG